LLVAGVIVLVALTTPLIAQRCEAVYTPWGKSSVNARFRFRTVRKRHFVDRVRLKGLTGEERATGVFLLRQASAGSMIRCNRRRGDG
jgi:hypothetical protein